jgi:Glycosyl transferase family 2
VTVSPHAWVDVLMITCQRPDYVRLSLPHLLDTVDDRTRVWVWQNGDHEETLEVVKSHLGHPRLHHFHHSRDNVRLNPPTNWLWAQATGELLGKVDDDCLVAPGWVDTLRQAHTDHTFGVIGSWRFQPEDYRPELAEPKTEKFPGGHQILRNLWVQGSGYLVPRDVVWRFGPMRPSQSFVKFCLEVARSGLVNGWYVPFIREEHLDDPRSPRSLLRSDADLLARLPLSAQAHGVQTLADWTAQMRRSAYVVQAASLDARRFVGWRARRRSVVRRVQRAIGRRSTW